ncbi:MAG: hypothetical protein A2020_09240 [Lentisphaerae bacterium GWF2_45_14]|nr:MAG: hypothetical protein A2020_09240 [Lentisphaerae bacterium GWF2_45_14]
MTRKLGLICMAALLLQALALADSKAAKNVEENECSEIPLIDFKDAQSRNDWSANPWGGGKIDAEVRDSVGDKFPWLMRITLKDALATLSNQKLFSSLEAKWNENPVTGFYIWYRTSNFKGQAKMIYSCQDGEGNDSFSNAIGLENDGKWHISRLRLTGWNKQNHQFNIEKLKGISFTFKGSGVFEIGEVGMLCSYRILPGILRSSIKKLPVAPCAEFKIDGEIDDKESSTSSKLGLSLFNTQDAEICGSKQPEDGTEIFLSWNDNGVYCAARCFKKDMNKLKADFTEDSVKIWEDECVEFYFDTERKMVKNGMKKYAINAKGKTGIENFGDRDGELKVAAKKFDDRWEAELFLPWKTLGIKEKAPFAMGFNATRTTYDGDKMRERSGWTTPKWDAVPDFGAIFITNGKKAIGQTDKNVLGFAGKGKYVLAGTAPDKTSYKFKLYTPSGEERLLCKSGNFPSGNFEYPFLFPVKKTGYFPFSLTVYDNAENIVNYMEGRISEQAMDDWKPLPVNSVSLFPEPKILQKSEGFFDIKPGIKYFLASEEIGLCGKKLEEDIKTFFNISFEKTQIPEDARIIIDLNMASQTAKNIVSENKLQDDLKKVKHDGFLLLITSDRIFITAKEKRGVLYGVNALLDLVKVTSESTAAPQVCNLKVVDWPDSEIRYWFHHMRGYMPQNKYDVALYEKVLAAVPLNFRYNGYFIETDDYYKWQNSPGFGEGPQWSTDDFRHVMRFLHSNYVPVMPSIQSLGHMEWLLRKNEYAHLREDGDLATLCTKHPDSYKILFGFYDEMLKLCSENPEYKPTHFIVQLDEARWKTGATPEEKRCKYCKEIPKNKIYIDHIKKISEYMKEKNIKPIMWSDMMIEEHNGLNEFKCVEIRDQVPKNMIMGHWSLSDYQSIPRFEKLGLENWKTPTGYHLSRLNENMVSGQMFLIWTYYWWLSDSRCKSQGSYGPMAQTLYANSAWNNFLDDDNSSWIKYTKIYGNWLMHNWSRKPSPHANNQFKTIDLSAAINDTVMDKEAGDGHGWFDCGPEKDLSQLDLNIESISGIPVKFAMKDGETAFIKFNKLKKESAELKIEMKTGSLILLHAADLADADRSVAMDRKNYADPLKGTLVAKYTVFYEDGKTETFSALFGWNLSPWNYDSMNMNGVFSKYVIDSRSLLEGKTPAAKNKNLAEDIALYQYEWVNPNPNVPIKTVKIESSGSYISYGVLAITARGVK